MTQRRFPIWPLICWALAALLLIVGLAGGDRWFYETVSLRFNTLDPADRDWYHRTYPVWSALRFFPHVFGILISYFAILTFHRRGVIYAQAALAGVLAAALTANIAQQAIGRIRPNQADSQWAFTAPFAHGLFDRAEVCFPSGEAGTAFGLAVVLALCFPRLRVIFHAIAVLVALARVLPGNHYVSDVVAGAMLGVVLGRWAFRATLHIINRGQPDEQAPTQPPAPSTPRE